MEVEKHGGPEMSSPSLPASVSQCAKLFSAATLKPEFLFAAERSGIQTCCTFDHTHYGRDSRPYIQIALVIECKSVRRFNRRASRHTAVFAVLILPVTDYTNRYVVDEVEPDHDVVLRIRNIQVA